MKTKSIIAVGLVAGLSIGAQATAQPQPPRSNPPAYRGITPPGAPQSFADIVDRVAPAVVTVRTRRQVEVRSPNFPGLPFEFFGLPSPNGPATPQPRPQQREQRGEGSGFFVSADGYIVTNNHVVENAQEVEVILPDRREMKARVVGRDAPTDLAVLKVEGRGYPFVSFANQGAPRVGDWVVAVGNPFGLGGTATAGIVSAYGREVGSTFVDYIQIDAAINRGNSGGPTFDAQGRVIGVNSMIFSPSGGSVGIGFAIPAYIADDVVRRLIADGRIERGYVGASIQGLTEDIAESQGLTNQDGALVADVTPGAPAEQAGVLAGDIVTSVNGRRIENASQLVRQIAATRPGDTIRLGLIRDGRARDVSVRAGVRPSEESLTGESTPRPSAGVGASTRLGVTVRPLDEAARQQFRVPASVRGALIESVEDESDAAAKGLRRGDVIVRANERPISGPADIAAVVDEARRSNRQNVLLFIYRDGRQQAVAVRLTTARAESGPVN